MKLGLSLLMLAIAGSVVPDAAAGQKARPDPVAVKTPERVLGVCSVIANEERKGENGETYLNSQELYPIGNARTYLLNYEHRSDVSDEDINSASVTILQEPKYGTFTREVLPINGVYRYSPNVGYVGKDSVEVLVEIKGIKVKVLYFIHATEYREPNPYDNNCNEAPTNPWKISQVPNGTPILTLVNYPSPFTDNTGSSSTDTAPLASTLSASILSTLSVDPSLVTFSRADLAGGAVGQANK